MTPLSPARTLFVAAIRVPDEEIDLIRAALLVSVEDDPDAAVEAALAQLDLLAAGLPADLVALPPRAQVERLGTHLHGALGFRGNVENYYSPVNSLMTRVLATRTGIPITLALVYMEVARRRGITLLPIGLPGHLMVRHAGDAGVYLDPFTGDVLSQRECLERVAGPGGADQFSPGALDSLGSRPFLFRLLANLKGAYLRAQPPNPAGALAASERMLLLTPEAVSELRDQAALHLQLGQRSAALLDLERYLNAVPDAPAAVRERAQALYTQLSRLN